MKKVLLLLTLIVFLMSMYVLAARSQAPDQPESIVRVSVRYDPDHDGFNQSVGPGRVVEARVDNTLFAVSQTNDQGVAPFVLPYGVYKFSAWVQSTRFLYYWDCTISDVVNSPTESFLMVCHERFFLKLPFASSGTAVE